MTTLLLTHDGAPRWIRLTILYWLAAGIVFWLLPRDLSSATAIVVMALFVVSLDLLLGFAGVVSFGHAMYFGIGAYAAALLMLNGYAEPITGAVLSGALAAAVAGIVSPVVLRLSGLPQIMVTLVLGVLTFEAANKAVWLTGGDDGIGNIQPAALLGLFQWTAYGHTQYWYALTWLFLALLCLQWLLGSAMGLSFQGCRDNPQRMRFIGANVRGRLTIAFVLSAFIGGVAGAVSAQTTKFVGLDALAVERSIDGLVMLVLGGAGRLYGVFIGTPIYMVVRQLAAQWNPFHWMFVVGGLLVVIVLLARGGLLGLFERVRSSMSRGKRGAAS